MSKTNDQSSNEQWAKEQRAKESEPGGTTDGLNPTIVGELVDSRPLLGDKQGLKQRLAESGYLYFRQVLDHDAIGEIVSSLGTELRRQNLVDDTGKWTGLDVRDADEAAVHEILDYDQMWAHPSMQRLYDAVFGEPVFVFRQTAARLLFPGTESITPPTHQDGAYIGPTQEFLTVWTPLLDCSQLVGGLALADGSHKGGLREHVETPRKPFKAKGDAKFSGVRLDAVTERWLYSDYRVGDVVMFDPFLVHCGLPNRSRDSVRLSIDTRVQPESVERGFYATHTTIEMKSGDQSNWSDEIDVS